MPREKPLSGQVAGLYFQLIRPEHRRADDTPLLLLPGLLSDGRQFQRLARLLKRPVLLVDPLGSPRSEAPPEPDDYRFALQCERLTTLLTSLSLGPVDCAGFSMGGMWAQHLLLYKPQLIRRLSLVATTAAVDPRLRVIVQGLLAQHQAGVPHSVLLRMLHVLCFSPRFLDPPSILPMLEALADGKGLRDHAVSGQLLALLSHDVAQALERRNRHRHPDDHATIGAVIAGSEDFLMPPLQQARLAALCGQPAPDIIPSVGHALWIECPELVALSLNQAMPVCT